MWRHLKRETGEMKVLWRSSIAIFALVYRREKSTRNASSVYSVYFVALAAEQNIAGKRSSSGIGVKEGAASVSDGIAIEPYLGSNSGIYRVAWLL